MCPTDSTEFSRFSSPRGWQICHKIIADRLPFGPHDYQLEGITQALDGQDVIAISVTGSWKSAYIYMLAVVLFFPCSFRCRSIGIFVVQVFSGIIFGWRGRIILENSSEVGWGVSKRHDSSGSVFY